ncbi:hypothetical protein N7499_000075 [Penicillium canescens]|nr:hypothetical protein N7522_005655 [Penicillium canescens]KAJ6100445.1 hypothetical protein N7499_000075 [Penicillium canescens]KAJ6172909.1 hypothetical protein N7485_005721 [Penicillium canescens]
MDQAPPPYRPRHRPLSFLAPDPGTARVGRTTVLPPPSIGRDLNPPAECAKEVMELNSPKARRGHAILSPLLEDLVARPPRREPQLRESRRMTEPALRAHLVANLPNIEAALMVVVGTVKETTDQECTHYKGWKDCFEPITSILPDSGATPQGRSRHLPRPVTGRRRLPPGPWAKGFMQANSTKVRRGHHITSPIVAKLKYMPKQREPHLRDSRAMTNTLLLSHVDNTARNMEAAMMTTVGQAAINIDLECDSCQEGNGPWARCVHLPYGEGLGMGCNNCRQLNREQSCKHYRPPVAIAQIISPTPRRGQARRETNATRQALILELEEQLRDQLVNMQNEGSHLVTLTEAMQASLHRLALAVARQNVTDAQIQLYEGQIAGILTVQRGQVHNLATQHAIASRLSDLLRHR